MSAISHSVERARARRWAPWLGLLLLLGAALPASASRQRPVPLAERTARAERIIVGRVTQVQVGHHPRYPRVPVTRVTVRVRQTWKGEPVETLTFLQYGDASADGPRLPENPGRVRIVRFPELPTYREGEEVLLFLRRPSAEGLTSPVGGHSGKIAVRRDPTTGASGVGEAALLAPHSARPSATLPLTTVRDRVLAALRAEGGNR